ncbi:MAG: PEGA domain-containing protein [Polyangiaceae bacterium]
MLTLLFAMLLAGTAVAAEPAQVEARKAFTAGERAFEDGDYQSALGEFERAFSLVAHDAVRFNIAVCLERLGRYREAVAQYEAAAVSSTLKEPDRERAKRGARIASKQLATVVVESGDAGRPVVVDGDERCRTPCRVTVDPGRHRVSVGSGEAVELELGRGQTSHVAQSASKPAASAKQTRQPPKTLPRPRAKPSESRGPGVLTWTGGALAALGTGGTVFFGLRTERIHDDYVAEPTRDRFDDGRTSRTLTNVSLGVAAVGVALVVVDLVFLSPQPKESAAFPNAVRF